MRLINKNKLLPPRKCLVCERVPDGRVVDTLLKNFNTVASDPMRGRKYVCERCGSRIAEALAYPPPKRVSDWLDTIERQKAEMIALREASDNGNILAELKAYIEEQKREIALDD